VDDYADHYLLSPIDDDALALALEDWAIFRRWEAAYYRGDASIDTIPALPGERERHEELERLLQGRLAVHPARAVRKRATFRRIPNPGPTWRVMPLLEVHWLDPG
jgi:hypothetical protein